jgi:hypothetical protein
VVRAVRASICASDEEAMPRRTQSVLDADDDLARRARKWVEETTLAQGLSVHVTDPVAPRRIARIFGWTVEIPDRHDHAHLGVGRRA